MREVCIRRTVERLIPSDPDNNGSKEEPGAKGWEASPSRVTALEGFPPAGHAAPRFGHLHSSSPRAREILPTARVPAEPPAAARGQGGGGNVSRGAGAEPPRPRRAPGWELAMPPPPSRWRALITHWSAGWNSLRSGFLPFSGQRFFPQWRFQGGTLPPTGSWSSALLALPSGVGRRAGSNTVYTHFLKPGAPYRIVP